jgi:hypothetical protein
MMPTSKKASIRSFCTDCDATTTHVIDWFEDKEWWVCEICLEPYGPVRPVVRRSCEYSRDEPIYDPWLEC